MKKPGPARTRNFEPGLSKNRPGPARSQPYSERHWRPEEGGLEPQLHPHRVLHCSTSTAAACGLHNSLLRRRLDMSCHWDERGDRALRFDRWHASWRRRTKEFSGGEDGTSGEMKERKGAAALEWFWYFSDFLGFSQLTFYLYSFQNRSFNFDSYNFHIRPQN